MAKQRFLNNFTSTFIAAVKDAPSSGTPETELDYGVLRISDGAAGSLINPTDGDYYLLTAFKRSGSVESNIEVMRVTGVNNATPGECRITVQRAQEGTSAKAFVAGDYLSLRITKGTAENFSQPADLATKEPIIAAPTSAPTEKYWRGDKTWRDFFTDVRAATLTGLSTATNSPVVSTDTVLQAVGKLQAQVGSSAAGFRNKIINGSFGINQRAYVSGATTTAGQYTLDRWKVTGTGGVTFSTTDNKTTVTIPSGQTLQQVIEGLNLESGAYVLSWEGTAQGRINGGAYGASGAVTATITGGANTTIEFNTGTVALVMLEKSSVATPFECRPYGLELALCQRYYYRVRATGSGPTVFANGYNYSTTSANVTIPFPVPMRSAPSALEQSGVASDYVIAHGAASTACSSVPTLFVGTSNVMGSLIFTVASGLTVGQGVLGTSTNNNTNAYLGFPAEL